MMFHINNLGLFGRGLEGYADMNGFLPSCFEDLLEMNYDLCAEEIDENGVWDEECRNTFWEEASEVIEQAQDELEQWQRDNASWTPPFGGPFR
jgi:hypothetical protein